MSVSTYVYRHALWMLLLWAGLQPLHTRAGDLMVRPSLQFRTDTIPKLDTLPPVDTSNVYYRINRSYLGTFWTDFKAVGTRPFHWDARNLRKAGIVLGSAGLLAAFADKPLQRMMLRNQKEGFDKAANIFYPLGNRFPPFFLAGMYVAGVVSKSRRIEHASLVAVKSLLISTIYYTATKAVIRRQRPTRTDNPYLFTAPFSGEGFTSFPSGHANTAFTTATAFAMEYRDIKWVPWVVYSLASLTALSRMYQNRHWSSDVLIGSAIGHFVTRTVYKNDLRRKYARRKMQW